MAKKTGKIEAKTTTDGNTFVTIDGTSYQLDSKSSQFADRYNEGDEVEITYAGNMISFITMAGGTPAKPNEAKSFMDDYVTFEELLKEAHKRKVNDIQTHMKHFDFEKQEAIVEARVSLYDEVNKLKRTFWAHGDASHASLKNNALIQPHFLRMAETRAVARALRLALGIGKTAKEELDNE